MSGPTASDLIFSEQANHNFSKTLGELKRSALSIHNRLQSIQEDAAFAQRVATAYGRPVIANERCGSWYIDPQKKSGSAYFKSTDGHTGVWKFSTRRLNLHLLDIIGKNDGCIIVDSTRRGKRMPDALSKTIPIWCAVLNSFLFNNGCDTLHTPPNVVSKSEHAQVTALLPTFLESLKALGIPTSDLKSQITKPLRPIWITPDSQLSTTGEVFSDCHPVICCTVSRRVPGGEASEGGYIQGAGDDTENWAYGLTPSIYWGNQQVLLSTPDTSLRGLIKSLVEAAVDVNLGEGQVRSLKPTSLIYIAPTSAATPSEKTDSGVILLLPKVTERDTWRISSSRLEVGLGPHKIGSRNLREALQIIVDFANEYWHQQDPEGEVKSAKSIIIACESGKDLSIGVGLALICLFFDGQGKLRKGNIRKPRVDKAFVRGRLGWISTSLPDANPSRSTLQSVNSFLMERPYPYPQ